MLVRNCRLITRGAIPKDDIGRHILEVDVEEGIAGGAGL